MKFKVGDRVRCFYNDNGMNQYVGQEGKVTVIGRSGNPQRYPYSVDFANACFGDHELELINGNNSISMDKHYRLKKDLPGITAGAVLKKFGSVYEPINDLYNTDAVEEGTTPRYNIYSVEHAAEWFERVYPVNLLTKTVYKLKEEAKELFSKEQSA